MIPLALRRCAPLMLAVVCATGLPRAAGQQAANATSRQAPDRVTALQREAESLAGQEKTLLGELRQLELERDLKTEELHRTERELAEVGQRRGDAARRIAELEGRVSVDRPALARRLVEIYKLGRPGYLRLLLDANGIRSAARAYRAVSALVESDRRRVAEFKRNLDEMRATERRLAADSAKAEALQAQAQLARQAAERAVAGHAALIAEIDARRDLNARLAGEMRQAQQKLGALAPGATPVADAVVPASLAQGNLEWPAAGRLAARFGPQRDPRFGTTTVRAGVEIAAAPGASVQAVEAGTVAYAEPFTGFGNLVIVDHGRQSYSLYGYLESLSVARGAAVARGQQLGKVGRNPTGKAGLYFELRIDGRAVDPLQWLSKR